MNITADLIRYEEGDLTHEEVVALFQYLLESGMIDHLQGSYHRMARILLDAGEIE